MMERGLRCANKELGIVIGGMGGCGRMGMKGGGGGVGGGSVGGGINDWVGGGRMSVGSLE